MSQPAATVSWKRVPPQNLEAEEAILGAMLIDNRAINRVRSLDVEAGHFHSPANQKLFTAIVNLHVDEGEAVDRVTLGNYLRRFGQLEEVGGLLYLDSLDSEIVTAANVEYHIGILLEKAGARAVIEEATQAIEKAHADHHEADHISQELHSRISRRIVRRSDEGWSTAGEILVGVSEDYERARQMGLAWAGLDCGFPDVNDMMSGLCGGELTIIGARPNIGKTTLVMQMALTVGEAGSGVAAFSLEMTKKQLLQRVACIEAGIDIRKFRSGRLNDLEHHRFQAARERIQGIPLYVDHTASLSLPKLTTKLERLVGDQDIGLVIVDYLQLMDGPGRSQHEVFEAISRGLQNQAKSTDLPFLVLSQLSREVERREDRRPRMSDLRESGGIEAAADNVLLIHRPAWYEDLVEKYDGDTAEFMRWVELIHDKTRFGPTGTVRLTWLPDTAEFANPVTQQPEPVQEQLL